MISGFFKNLFQAIAFACLLTAVYFNIVVVPDNNLGLLVEKTAGLKTPLLKPGYHWNWTGFVPYKWNLYNIDLNPPVVNVRLKQPLRYGRYLEDAEIFSINLNINIKYNLSEKSVLFFWNYLKKNIPDYNNYISSRVRLMVELYLTEVYRREEDVAFLNVLLQKYISNEGRFKQDWEAIFKEEEVSLEQFEISKLEVPEAAVYLENLKNIDKIFQARREATVKRLLAEANVYEKNLIDQAELDKTEKFIEIMKKYPDIIKYYQIEKINPRANIILMNDPGNSGEIVKDTLRQDQVKAQVQGEAQSDVKNDVKGKVAATPPEEKGKIEPIKK